MYSWWNRCCHCQTPLNSFKDVFFFIAKHRPKTVDVLEHLQFLKSLIDIIVPHKDGQALTGMNSFADAFCLSFGSSSDTATSSIVNSVWHHYLDSWAECKRNGGRERIPKFHEILEEMRIGGAKLSNHTLQLVLKVTENATECREVIQVGKDRFRVMGDSYTWNTLLRKSSHHRCTCSDCTEKGSKKTERECTLLKIQLSGATNDMTARIWMNGTTKYQDCVRIWEDIRKATAGEVKSPIAIRDWNVLLNACSFIADDEQRLKCIKEHLHSIDTNHISGTGPAPDRITLSIVFKSCKSRRQWIESYKAILEYLESHYKIFLRSEDWYMFLRFSNSSEQTEYIADMQQRGFKLNNDMYRHILGSGDKSIDDRWKIVNELIEQNNATPDEHLWLACLKGGREADQGETFEDRKKLFDKILSKDSMAKSFISLWNVLLESSNRESFMAILHEILKSQELKFDSKTFCLCYSRCKDTEEIKEMEELLKSYNQEEDVTDATQMHIRMLKETDFNKRMKILQDMYDKNIKRTAKTFMVLLAMCRPKNKNKYSYLLSCTSTEGTKEHTPEQIHKQQMSVFFEFRGHDEDLLQDVQVWLMLLDSCSSEREAKQVFDDMCSRISPMSPPLKAFNILIKLTTTAESRVIFFKQLSLIGLVPDDYTVTALLKHLKFDEKLALVGKFSKNIYLDDDRSNCGFEVAKFPYIWASVLEGVQSDEQLQRARHAMAEYGAEPHVVTSTMIMQLTSNFEDQWAILESISREVRTDNTWAIIIHWPRNRKRTKMQLLKILEEMKSHKTQNINPPGNNCFCQIYCELLKATNPKRPPIKLVGSFFNSAQTASSFSSQTGKTRVVDLRASATAIDESRRTSIASLSENRSWLCRMIAEVHVSSGTWAGVLPTELLCSRETDELKYVLSLARDYFHDCTCSKCDPMRVPISELDARSAQFVIVALSRLSANEGKEAGHIFYCPDGCATQSRVNLEMVAIAFWKFCSEHPKMKSDGWPNIKHIRKVINSAENDHKCEPLWSVFAKLFKDGLEAGHQVECIWGPGLRFEWDICACCGIQGHSVHVCHKFAYSSNTVQNQLDNIFKEIQHFDLFPNFDHQGWTIIVDHSSSVSLKVQRIYDMIRSTKIPNQWTWAKIFHPNSFFSPNIDDHKLILSIARDFFHDCDCSSCARFREGTQTISQKCVFAILKAFAVMSRNISALGPIKMCRYLRGEASEQNVDLEVVAVSFWSFCLEHEFNHSEYQNEPEQKIFPNRDIQQILDDNNEIEESDPTYEPLWRVFQRLSSSKANPSSSSCKWGPSIRFSWDECCTLCQSVDHLFHDCPKHISSICDTRSLVSDLTSDLVSTSSRMQSLHFSDPRFNGQFESQARVVRVVGDYIEVQLIDGGLMKNARIPTDIYRQIVEKGIILTKLHRLVVTAEIKQIGEQERIFVNGIVPGSIKLQSQHELIVQRNTNKKKATVIFLNPEKGTGMVEFSSNDAIYKKASFDSAVVSREVWSKLKRGTEVFVEMELVREFNDRDRYDITSLELFDDVRIEKRRVCSGDDEILGTIDFMDHTGQSGSQPHGFVIIEDDYKWGEISIKSAHFLQQNMGFNEQQWNALQIGQPVKIRIVHCPQHDDASKHLVTEMTSAIEDTALQYNFTVKNIRKNLTETNLRQFFQEFGRLDVFSLKEDRENPGFNFLFIGVQSEETAKRIKSKKDLRQFPEWMSVAESSKSKSSFDNIRESDIDSQHGSLGISGFWSRAGAGFRASDIGRGDDGLTAGSRLGGNARFDSLSHAFCAHHIPQCQFGHTCLWLSKYWHNLSSELKAQMRCPNGFHTQAQWMKAEQNQPKVT